MDITEISTPWYDGLKSGVDTAASPEAARHYYSVKNLLVNQARNNMYYVRKTSRTKDFLIIFNFVNNVRNVIVIGLCTMNGSYIAYTITAKYPELC